MIFVTQMHASVPSFDVHTSPGTYFLTPTLIDFDHAEPRILLSLSAHLLLLLLLLLLIFFFLLLDGCSHPIRRTMTAGKRQAPPTKRLSRRISKILRRGRVLRQVIGPSPFQDLCASAAAHPTACLSTSTHVGQSGHWVHAAAQSKPSNFNLGETYGYKQQPKRRMWPRGLT